MSLYLSHPDIPAAKINAYPKRRRKQLDILIFPQHTRQNLPTLPPAPADEVLYADFFTNRPASAKQSA